MASPAHRTARRTGSGSMKGNHTRAMARHAAAPVSWRRMTRRALLVVLSSLAAACSRPAPPSPAAGASVLLVTLDTLRADRFDAARMPRLHALAADGLAFDEALSSVPLTLPSHCSILSGREPLHHGVRD